ncbi:MAG: alpha/beta hydrolase [Pseudomonadota bacterium]
MNRLDPAWLNAQYDNRARFPSYALVLDRWARASATACEGLSRRLDVAYGDGPNETLDIFPAPHADAPVMVFIHGGWWRALDKRQHAFVAPSFVDAGAMVVVPNHALCPAVTIEQIVMQLVKALAWVYRHAALYGGDTRRIVVVGHSAGGHLASMLLSCRWQAVARDLPPDLVRAALSISGLFDLEPVRQTPFLQADLKLTAASARKLSPVHFPPPAGPLFSVVGGLESEEHQRQSQLPREVWGPRAVPVCEVLPGVDHYDVMHELVDPGCHLHGWALELLGLSQPESR